MRCLSVVVPECVASFSTYTIRGTARATGAPTTICLSRHFPTMIVPCIAAWIEQW
jgi:hypothetical protein